MKSPPRQKVRKYFLGGTVRVGLNFREIFKTYVKGENSMTIMTTEEKIRESLLDQLKAQNKLTDYTVDLVETYMKHWRLKERLSDDIDKNGIRITVSTGNGHDKTLANPSVTDLQRETSIMLQILDKLDLRTPVIVGSSDDYL